MAGSVPKPPALADPALGKGLCWIISRDASQPQLFSDSLDVVDMFNVYVRDLL